MRNHFQFTIQRRERQLLKFHRFIHIFRLDDNIGIRRGVGGLFIGGRAQQTGVHANGVLRQIQFVYRNAVTAGGLLAVTDTQIQITLIGICKTEGVLFPLGNEPL